MTDNEIIKANACCANEDFQDCKHCPLYIEHQPCNKTLLPKITLDLLNRQKAEIKDERAKGKMCAEVIARQDKELEDLNKEVEDLREIVFTDRTEAIKNLKVEAVKEFAEELTERFKRREKENQCSWCKHSTVFGRRSSACDRDNGNGRVRCFLFDQWESCVDDIVDSLVKEMIEEANETND